MHWCIGMKVEEARRQWAEEEEGELIDDCTAIVALLASAAPPHKTYNISAVAAGVTTTASQADRINRAHAPDTPQSARSSQAVADKLAQLCVTSPRF